MESIHPLEILSLSGTPRQRGQIYGEALSEKIRMNMAGWKENLGRATGVNPDIYLGEFIQQTHFQASIQKWTPELWDEMTGIAEGAGLDFNTVYAFQLPDEEWLFRRYYQLQTHRADGDHCSSLGIFNRGNYGSSLLAQNMDVPKYYDGYQALLFIRHPNSDHEVMIFVYAGIIALNGLNDRGVGVCVNTLMQLDSSIDGLPVAFVIRGLLDQPTFPESKSFLKNIKHASGQNYMVGSPREILDFECSSGKVVQFSPEPSHVYHTNHPMVNDNQQHYRQLSQALSPEQREAAAEGQSNTLARFAWLEHHVRSLGAEISVTDIKTILSDTKEAPICADRANPFAITLGCTIMELTLPPVLHLSPGPPSQTEFMGFTFSTDRR